MKFGATFTVIGAYPYSMFMQDRFNIFLGPKNSSPLKKDDNKYWKISTGRGASISRKHDGYRLLAIKGDRATEFTLSKV